MVSRSLCFSLLAAGVLCMQLLPGQASASEPITQFKVTYNAAIAGFNNEHLTAATTSDCATACLARGWCKSFDYYKSQNACDLSDKSAEDAGGLKTDYAGNPYDHYDRPDTTQHVTVKNVGQGKFLNISEGSYWPARFQLEAAADETWAIQDTSFGPNVKTLMTAVTPGVCADGSWSNNCPDFYRLCAHDDGGFRARTPLADAWAGTPSSWDSAQCAWIIEDLGDGTFKMRNYWIETTYGSYVGYLRCTSSSDCTFDYGTGASTTAHWKAE